MTTLKDIAKELGLSPATVSRALNGFPEVGARTRATVEEAAERMGYRPNPLAKKLVSGRSGMIGLVLKPDGSSQADPTLHEIMFGLSDQLAQRDMDLVFHASSSDDLLEPYKRLLDKNILDGFILNAPEEDDPRIRFLQERDVPFVVHGRAAGHDYAYYDIDNRGLARDSVDLLLNLGHRRIALLNGQAGRSYAQDREAGYRDAMGRAGLTVPEFAVQYGPANEDHGYTKGLALLSGRFGPRPTAIFCVSTPVAAGLYRAAQDIGLSIPGDLSVIAHDDAVPQMRAVNFEPALTVTRSPLRDACKPLAAKMEALLKGAPADILQTLAPVDLIARNSTGPVPTEGETPW
ncbi:LacI family transcriptional regulator [Loktanella sp. IMCC34160]|uniref:substrate-binding domain-containing protein n=1 Tax=Loktanella sp. IMCC34160 TaxID=2510646 RepID=UPI00101D3703|nr:substrate-binding domain-containing protein [Loktanella sp. IMCC34160]RYG93056.1 LacI family transcriptional regulator [Loktanella sp. IMCC34160]